MGWSNTSSCMRLSLGKNVRLGEEEKNRLLDLNQEALLFRQEALFVFVSGLT